MEFECEYCGWSITGGDETGITILDKNGEIVYEIDYCFHCGRKIEEDV